MASLIWHALCPGAGLAEGDENCKKFMEKTMYDSFQKVHVCFHSRASSRPFWAPHCKEEGLAWLEPLVTS